MLCQLSIVVRHTQYAYDLQHGQMNLGKVTKRRWTELSTYSNAKFAKCE